MVARRLMDMIFKPRSQTLQVVCIHGNPDLEEYCRYSDIEVCLYPDLAVGQLAEEGKAVLPDVLMQGEPSSAPVEWEDLRLSPDIARRRGLSPDRVREIDFLLSAARQLRHNRE